MKKKYFIDYFSENERLLESAKTNRIEYKFVNVLYYLKEKYEITVVDLSKLFMVNRQTMYNYFSIKTVDLPLNIKNRLADIYGELNFKDALEKELGVEVDGLKELNLIDRLDGLIDARYLEYYDIYYLSEHDNTYFETKLKNIYSFGILFNSALKEIEEQEKISDNIGEFRNHLKYNTLEYNEKLLNYLLKIPKNDTEFLNYLSYFFEKDLVEITTNPKYILENNKISERAKKYYDSNMDSFGVILTASIKHLNTIIKKTREYLIDNKYDLFIDLISPQNIDTSDILNVFDYIGNHESLLGVKISHGFKFMPTITDSEINIYLYYSVEVK